MIVSLLAAVLAISGEPAAVRAVPRLTQTEHVPAIVVDRQAALVGQPAPSATLELAISLPLRDEAGLQATLAAMYDPRSPSFRRYLSVAEFTARYGPSAGDYASLVRFALTHNLHPHGFAANRHVLDVAGSVGDVERAFHVKIGVYADPARRRTFFAPDREPTLDLAVPVLHVSGLDDYDVPVNHLVHAASMDATKPTGSGPFGSFVGSDIRAAYYGGTALAGTGQTVGLFEFGSYNIDDVKAYFASLGQRLSVPIVAVSLNGVNPNCRGVCNDGEQALDIEESVSMAPGLERLVFYTGANDVSILNAMAVDDSSKQLSCSWGWTPNALVIDPIFEEFAAQGQSFLVATGDDGYHLKRGAVWPADDQYVTAVGGTALTTAGPGGPWLSETGWVDSGGGPSPDGIRLPAYQAPFVTRQNGGSTRWRNVPDIAGDAAVDNYSCYSSTCTTGNGGTSFAAPLWAGYIALVNQFAAALNEPSVGFLNPALYALGGSSEYPRLFHDEVSGYNGKYRAVPGFDLVTGFGSPNGDALIGALARGGQ
jgi:subtilase family serine protease